jgi:plastocyanin
VRLRLLAVTTCAAALAVSGCGSVSRNDSSGSSNASTSPSQSSTSQTGSPGASVSASASASASSKAGETAISISVSGNKVSPQPTRVSVKPGAPVRLTVTTDQARQLHVHGVAPEIETETTPGTPTVVQFTAPTVPGIYEVELHDPDTTLVQLQVQ